MISTSGPGLGLTFLLVVPLLFAVPIALATAEMTTLMPVEGGLLPLEPCGIGRFLGIPMRVVELDRNFSDERRLRRGDGGLS